MDLKQENGFTLIELLIVSAVTIVISISLVTNFVDSQKNQSLNNSVALFSADVRKAQSLSSSTFQFQGNKVCGYGLHYLNSTSYIIYAIPRPVGTNCGTLNHNYTSGRDLTYETINIKVVNITVTSFSDIFFEPPDLKVYIDDKAFPPQPAGTSTKASFCFKGDAVNCRSLEIFLSGQINFL